MRQDQAVPVVPAAPHEEVVTHERAGFGWPLAALSLLVGALLVGMLVLMPLFGQPNYEAAGYDANRVGDHVSVRGQPAATGARAFLPDSRMVPVGRTDEGFLVYIDSHRSYGGGGGGLPGAAADLSAYDELWVRTGENAYTRVTLGAASRGRR